MLSCLISISGAYHRPHSFTLAHYRFFFSFFVPGVFSNPETVRIWTFASKTFAELASGESFVVRRLTLMQKNDTLLTIHDTRIQITGRSTREGNIFHKDELPRLKRNRRITKITKIDSTTARRTVVFDRNANKQDAAANEANLCVPPSCLSLPHVVA
jgi:hypothetical protein